MAGVVLLAVHHPWWALGLTLTLLLLGAADAFVLLRRVRRGWRRWRARRENHSPPPLRRP